MTHQLLQVSNYLFSPIIWLDTVVPNELKIYPCCYYDYPFILKNINFDYSTMNQFITNHIEESSKIGVIENNDGIIEQNLNTQIRNTYNILPNQTFIDSYERFFEFQRSELETFFNISLIQSTSPQILIYEEGCFYKRHSDNCSEIIDENGELIEFKPIANHRVLTTVLFIADDFKGGELSFDYLFDKDNNMFEFKPNKGDFIAFLSNPYFSHSVKKVQSGRRISIVQWHNAIVH